MQRVWVVACFLAVCPVSVSYHKLRSAVFVDFPIMPLIPFAHIILLPSLHMVSHSSAQSLTLDRCIILHQLLDDDSVMTIRVVTNLITGEDQYMGPSPLLLGVLAGVILGDSWEISWLQLSL